MLLAGVPIDQVSLLLGHASVKITERSYSPFVKATQVQLQDSVRNAWSISENPRLNRQRGVPSHRPNHHQKLRSLSIGYQVGR
jgi:hypothetical protein